MTRFLMNGAGEPGRRRKCNRDIQTDSRRRSRLSDAPKQLASVYRYIGRLDEARDTELAALKLVPDDAETHYTVSVIDWTQAYKFSVDTLLSDGLQDDGLSNAHMSPSTCEKFKPHNAQLVDDAIAHLIHSVA
jgi:hypothetical protein